MTLSPDYTPYVDLTLYDKDPSDILAAAIATLQSRIPDWVPSSTNVEVMLLEALAIEVGEASFALNRIPDAMVRVLLALYGVEQDPGTAPSVVLRFNAYDTDGYEVPAETEVALLTPSGEYLSFYTTGASVIPEGSTAASVPAVARENTNIANGIPINSTGELIEAIVGIETVETATVVSGGTLPETVSSWQQRGVQVLRRLVDTLVIPNHFTQAALENPLVYRATTIDNYDPDVGPSPGSNPGNVNVIVYGDGGPLTAPQMEALRQSLTLRANANLLIHVSEPIVQAVDVTVTVVKSADAVAADVELAILARLDEYLNPTTWPWSGTVRRNELISVIDQVAGVSYVDTITEPASDVVIGVGNALANAGAFSVTVT